MSEAGHGMMPAVVSLHQVIDLALACALLIAVPGPSVLFVIGRALSQGRRTALASVLGNTTGSYLAAVTVAVGLGPLLQRSDLFLQVIKMAGAGYLVWLGVQALRHSAAASPAAAAPFQPQPRWRSVRTGVVVGMTNPKVFIIFAAILPQFVDRSVGHVAIQMLILALVPLSVGLVTDTAWALAAGQARNWLSSTPGRSRAVARIGGSSMIGLGISVAATGRSD